MIKAIFFDLGGVLFTNGTKRFVGHISKKYKLDEEKVKNIVETGVLANTYREGKITRNEFWKKIKKELQLVEDIDELEREWINGYELIDGTKDIILELAKKYKVYFLSDNVKERVEAVNKKFNFLSWFADGVFSHEVGVRKPNLKIYRLALQKAHVKAEEVVFIDDKESSLRPACEIGITTILFKNSEQLRERLTKIITLH